MNRGMKPWPKVLLVLALLLLLPMAVAQASSFASGNITPQLVWTGSIEEGHHWSIAEYNQSYTFTLSLEPGGETMSTAKVEIFENQGGGV